MVAFLSRSLPLSVLLVLLGTPQALAWVHSMRCEGRFSYALAYDDTRQRLSIEVEGMKRQLRINRVKSEDGNILIWASTPAFGGDRDMLIQFGREKWARTYFRNGSEETITCR